MAEAYGRTETFTLKSEVVVGFANTSAGPLAGCLPELRHADRLA
jgi:hypothetical protein